MKPKKYIKKISEKSK